MAKPNHNRNFGNTINNVIGPKSEAQKSNPIEKTRSFYVHTCRHTAQTTSSVVRADSSILEEIQVLSSQIYATEILRCHLYNINTRYAASTAAVSGVVDNAMLRADYSSSWQ